MSCPVCQSERPGWGRFCNNCGAEQDVKSVNCASCGVANPPSVRFCSGCGQKLELRLCLECGAYGPADSVSCPECSSPFPSSGPDDETTSHPEDLHVAVAGRKDAEELWSLERRVLIRIQPEGMGELIRSAPMEAERYHDAFRNVLRRISREQEGSYLFVEDQGGLILLPVRSETFDEVALASISAAHAIQRQLRELEDERRRAGWSPLPVSIALYLGDEFSTQGSDQSTVIGSLEGEGSELLRVCPPGEICISEPIKQAIQHQHQERPVGIVSQSGGRWRGAYVVGPAKARLAGCDFPMGEFTPLVGREREFSHMKRRWADVARGGGSRHFTLIATRGMGRTRLCEELLSLLNEQKVHHVVVTCHEGSAYAPYQPFVDLLFYLLEVGPEDDEDTVRLRLLLAARRAVAADGWVASADSPEVLELTTMLGEMLGVDVSARVGLLDGGGLDPESIRQRTFYAVLRLLRGLSQEAPRVLIVEDVHHADSATLDLIEFLGATLRGSGRLFFICTALPTLLDARPNWGKGWRRHEVLTLSPVARESLETLVRSILEDEAEDPLITEIVATAQGRPGVAEVLAHEWLERQQRLKAVELESEKQLVASGTLPEKEKERRATEQLPAPQTVAAMARVATDTAAQSGREIAQSENDESGPPPEARPSDDLPEAHPSDDLPEAHPSDDSGGASEAREPEKVGTLAHAPAEEDEEVIVAAGASEDEDSEQAVSGVGREDSAVIEAGGAPEEEDSEVIMAAGSAEEDEGDRSAGVDTRTEDASESFAVGNTPPKGEAAESEENSPNSTAIGAEDAHSKALLAGTDKGRPSTEMPDGSESKPLTERPDEGESKPSEGSDPSSEASTEGPGEAESKPLTVAQSAKDGVLDPDDLDEETLADVTKEAPIAPDPEDETQLVVDEGDRDATRIISSRARLDKEDDLALDDDLAEFMEEDPVKEKRAFGAAQPGQIWSQRFFEMSAPARRMLSAAAVLGYRFSGGLLSELWQQDEDGYEHLEPLINEACDKGFLSRRVEPEPWMVSWRFRGTLVHRVAYEQIDLAERYLWHRRVARILELERNRARVRSSYGLVAYHYDQGEDFDHALRYYVLAGKAARQAMALAEGERLFARALSLRRESGFPDGGNENVVLHLLHGEILGLLNDPRQAISELETALEFARLRQDRRQECEVLMALCDLFDRERQHGQLFEFALQARDAAREAQNARLLVRSLRQIGWEHLRAGRPDEGRRALEQSVQVAMECGNPLTVADAMDSLGAFYYLRGNYGLAVRGYEDLLSLLKRALRPPSLAPHGR